jgi:hypothetical protein
VLDVDSVLPSARRREGLEDVGPGPLEEPLGVLLDSYASAGLHELGAKLLRGSLVHSLRMRLRAQEWVRRHPEVLDEVVLAPVVVVGMMRSGTTLLQRLLAADPEATCAYGWEVLEVAPPLDHDFDRPDPRIAAGDEREAMTRQFAPDLFAIHPMHAREAEEEIVFLADAFLSHVPEAHAHVPAYRSWLDRQDLAPAYAHLHRVLQLLQWTKRRRGEPVGRWVLKTPAHLGYLEDLRATFPDLHLVHLHRDPVETVASGASLNATLHAMHADSVDLARVGAQWLERTSWVNDRAMASRDSWDPARVTDVAFEDALADPLAQVARVYGDAGLVLTADAERSMRDWLAARPRDPSRPPYAPEDFGLSAAQIAERFAAYDARFRAGRVRTP